MLHELKGWMPFLQVSVQSTGVVLIYITKRVGKCILPPRSACHAFHPEIAYCFLQAGVQSTGVVVIWIEYKDSRRVYTAS